MTVKSLYEIATGAIMQTLETTQVFPEAPEGHAWIEGRWAWPTHYVDGSGEEPVVTERPTLAGFDKLEIVADGIDEAVILGLPDPATVRVDGEAIEATGGEFRFAADVAGEYAVTIDAFPYLPYAVTITATQP